MKANAHSSRSTHSAAGPTLPQAVRLKASRTEDGLSFVDASKGKHTLSFAEFSQRIDQRAMQLLAAGITPGSRVGLVLTNDEDFLVSFLGALAAGIVPVPMYPPLSFGKLDGYVQTASNILNAAGATALLTDKRVQSVLWSLMDKVPSLREVICTENLPSALARTIDAAAQPDVAAIGLDDVAFLQFTSGSTAEPKGVMVTHRNLLENMHAIMHHGLEIQSDDVAVTWLPLYHDMGLIGMMLAPIWYGVPTVHIPTLSFVKHPTSWMQAIHDYRGTITFAPNFAYALATRRTPPTILKTLDLSSLRVLGCGAEPNHPDTLQAFLRHFEPAGLSPQSILPCYGMAEATLAMSFVGLSDGLKVDRVEAETYHQEGRAVPIEADAGVDKNALAYVSCGRPLPGHDVIIVDDADTELPERTVGEIVFRGPSVTAGYYEKPEATAAIFRTNGLHTGDLGYIAEGELFVTGRKKDVVILNGRNYDPQTIEWVAAAVKGIRKGNVVAFSVPAAATEALVVVAETQVPAKDRAARLALAEEVKAQVRGELFLKVDDVVLLSPGQMPKTTSGKLQRQRTRLLYSHHELDKQGVRSLGSKGQTLVLVAHLCRSAWARSRHRVQRRLNRTIERINAMPFVPPIKRGANSK